MQLAAAQEVHKVIIPGTLDVMSTLVYKQKKYILFLYE